MYTGETAGDGRVQGAFSMGSSGCQMELAQTAADRAQALMEQCQEQSNFITQKHGTSFQLDALTDGDAESERQQKSVHYRRAYISRLEFLFS